MTRHGNFQYPRDLHSFQEVDDALRNKNRFIFDHEEHPAHARTIPEERVTALRTLLEEKAAIIMDLQHARREGMVEGFLASLVGEQRAVAEQIQHIVEQDRRGDPYLVEHEIQEYAMLPLRKDTIVPFLESIGVYVDKYGFGWVAKQEHYFRVNTRDAQVYLVSRSDPDKACRVCIVQARKGAEVHGVPTFNQNELLLLSKVVALLYDMLPLDIQEQIVSFQQSGTMGKNLFAFDPFAVFKEEYMDAYPELYRQHTEALAEAARSGAPQTGVFSTLRDEMLRELTRLKAIMNGNG
jgi:hypothetical protein